jgi:hypothetical protein
LRSIAFFPLSTSTNKESYSPRIFETLGITGTDTKLFATGFYGIAKALGMVIFSIWLVEKVGRRSGLIWGAFIGSLPMWYIGGYVFKADPEGAAARGDTSRNGWSYLAMVCVYLYGLIYCATWQVSPISHGVSIQGANADHPAPGHHLGRVLRDLPH